MARRSGTSTRSLVPPPPPAAPNASANNGVPPPSTIAAQIVDTAANANDQREPESKRKFEQLLDDYLNDPITRADDPDSLLIKLIYLVTQAGLDVLLDDNPFGVDLLLPPALKSIAAIQVTVQLRPHLLLSAKEESDDGTPHPPLFVWLLPKVLGLLGQKALGAIQHELRELLATFVGALTRASSTREYALSIETIYRSCVDSIVLALEDNNEIVRSSSSPSIKVILPPSSSISDIWPDSQNFVALPQGSQRVVTSRPQAILIGFHLVQVFMRCGDRGQSNSVLSLFRENFLPWIIDCSHALWQDYKQWHGQVRRSTAFDEIETAILDVLEALLLSGSVEDEYHCSSKVVAALSSHIVDLVKASYTSPLSTNNQVLLASLLTRVRGRYVVPRSDDPAQEHARRDLKRVTLDDVETAIASACQNVTAFSTLIRDLQLAFCLWTSPGDWPSEVDDIRQSLCSSATVSFSDEQLQQDSISVTTTFRQMNAPESPRASKRQKTAPDDDEDLARKEYDRLIQFVAGATDGDSMADLSGLHTSIASTYLNISEAEQCELLLAFGRIPCAGAKSLIPAHDIQVPAKTTCRVCDDAGKSPRDRSIYWNEADDQSSDWKDIVAALLAVTEIPEFRDSSKPRVVMAFTIGRVFNHISDSEYLNLEFCSLGQWLLGSMNRSLRELRVAAAHALMVFLRDDITKSVRDKNRWSSLGFFQELSGRESHLGKQITLIMAYGQAARVCGEAELQIILLRLVEFLGHPHRLVHGTAYDEISSIALALDTDPFSMMRPFWRSIGILVMKDLFSRPQKVTLLADVVGRKASDLKLDLAADTLPMLVLTKRKDVLQAIAHLRGKDVKIENIISQPRQTLASILALLLCQPVANPEQNAWETLIEVAPQFEKEYDLARLIQLEVVLVACEILKLAADDDDSKKPQYHRAFYSLAALAETRPGQRKVATKRSLDSFFEFNILGIMANFSEVLDAPLANHPLLERKRCVGAIREMIGLAKDDASLALPQIRACLQSAMADAHLCDQSFSVWSALLKVLPEEDLEVIVDQTFALIAQNWESFSDDTRLLASGTIDYLHKKHEPLLRERVDYLPSMGSITMLSKWEGEVARLKAKVDKISFFNTFSRRCNDQNAVVVRQALKELVPFLEANQKVLHDAAVSQKPLPALPALSRSLLDASVRFAEGHPDIPILCARCLGLIGGLDPYKVETVREKKHVLVLSNFDRAKEVINFSAFLLENILVKVFHSTTNSKSQGYLAYVMQELCKHCGFSDFAFSRPRSSQTGPAWERWDQISDAVQGTLQPFLSSRYTIRARNQITYEPPAYPIFNSEISHAHWLRTLVYDLLQKGKGQNPEMLFPVMARIIRGHDLSISTFLLPYAALNVIITGSENETMMVGRELLTVLKTDIQGVDQSEVTRIKQCSENVFHVLDYFNLWLQEKRRQVSEARVMAGKTGRGISEDEEMNAIRQISAVESITQMIPAEVISRRSVECGSYARALFHWEKHYRQEEEKSQNTGVFAKDELLQHLQFIYAQIDEPDSIEGISAHLQVLNPEQQVMEHRKAGRWTAAQSWYELSLAEKPDDTELQINLLTCLKESGQYDSILNCVDGINATKSVSSDILPFAAEAAWSTGKWPQLERVLSLSPADQGGASHKFNVGIGRALLALRSGQQEEFSKTIESLRAAVAAELSPATTASIHASHDHLVKLHVLYEIEAVSGTSEKTATDRKDLLEVLERRLDVIGAYTSDKQYVLGIRRAVMQLSKIEFTNLDISSAWLTTARLARKAEFTSTAFNAVMHAARLGDDASKIEYSKLMWKDGHHRKAIQNLQGAIASNAFQSREAVSMEVSVTTAVEQPQAANRTKAHAQLLLAKWLDSAGQTKAGALKEAYAAAILSHPRWDKGHYYLGRHYNKLLESEKLLPASKQSKSFQAGEHTKLIIENFIRSTVYGTKYYYQTIPKILTLWLDMGMEVLHNQPRTSGHKELHDHKVGYVDHINKYIKRYSTTRMPIFAWYTAFPQIITRISHPNKAVWEVLQTLIVSVASQYPQQALWSLMAVTRATQDDRRARGMAAIQKLRGETSKRKGTTPLELRGLILQSQKLTDALLAACDAPIEQRVSHVSLSRELGFNHKLAPCALVVPIEATMIANLPSGNDSRVIRGHNPFPQDAITISSFADDVLVLSSLQRPRKVTVRGSDGRLYGLLCKPKDDLRKDQRLMEFNAMINRALQQDIESSKRRLYIKTYGVTPLNEECGTIEWVEGLKPMRDIIIRLYRQRGAQIDYGELRLLLNEACSDPSKLPIFTDKILKKFQPVLHDWFVETFPEPEAWFGARLRYTRSCAVMSIVGHVLGLGDRHGENVLLEEGNGGTFHVDFNCLFDKGLTFEKPELVPFRLTHNMVDAMGPQGIEGPFRTAAELTYKQLRQHEDTLITILETFVHDPTADFLGGGKRRKKIAGVPDTPQEVLESVRGKVAGVLSGESVPLSVEGYVDALISMARDPRNLAAMYIGWCAFF
ncbi:hypothetical protein BU24DRAFT_419179 [Aaosphaeria arxii CBS 175.79]|uniref:non-specific serine/threonine protein kinase n=1 Tax=Aaosphaeria arxii CBS 175.79 TaxID=1450172 RepID=A0A6A5Y278_9PLEO|nr:uncharacterized protein BU24DRAFT_419179 [Aaosphaeria arxii CBS 175.79]KAF2019578.1 hypothetical protein BU24DRAFT_419179 [Aaosphaeria arxii CBS 175.79]